MAKGWSVTFHRWNSEKLSLGEGGGKKKERKKKLLYTEQWQWPERPILIPITDDHPSPLTQLRWSSQTSWHLLCSAQLKWGKKSKPALKETSHPRKSAKSCRQERNSEEDIFSQTTKDLQVFHSSFFDQTLVEVKSDGPFTHYHPNLLLTLIRKSAQVLAKQMVWANIIIKVSSSSSQALKDKMSKRKRKGLNLVLGWILQKPSPVWEPKGTSCHLLHHGSVLEMAPTDASQFQDMIMTIICGDRGTNNKWQ